MRGTNGKGTWLVGYDVQAAADTKHHLVVAHEVTNVSHDRNQLAERAGQAQSAIDQENIQVLADHGYFSGEKTRPASKPSRRPGTRS